MKVLEIELKKWLILLECGLKSICEFPPLGDMKMLDRLLVRVVISLVMITKLSWMIGLCLSLKRRSK